MTVHWRCIHGTNTKAWLGGAQVLGNLSVSGRPTNLDNNRVRAYCACSRCGWVLFGHFFSHLSCYFRLKCCLTVPLNT